MPLAGASAIGSGAVCCRSCGGRFPLFPGDSAVNVALAEAVQTMMIALFRCVKMIDFACFCFVCLRIYRGVLERIFHR